MNVEKEPTLRAAERKFHSDDMPGKRVRKANHLNEDTSTGDKTSYDGGIPKQVMNQQRLT